MTEHILYKTLPLKIDTALGTVEFVADKTNLESNESYINSISLLVEYIETARPEYVVYNKLNSEYRLPISLMDYTRHVIFEEFRKNGVKKVLVIVPKQVFEERYETIEQINPFMKGFTSTADAYQWVRLQRKR